MTELYIQQYVELFINIPSNGSDESNLPKGEKKYLLKNIYYYFLK